MSWGVGATDEARLVRKLDAMVGKGEDAAAIYRDRLGAASTEADVLIAARTDSVFRVPATRLAEAIEVQPGTICFTWASRVPGLSGVEGALASCVRSGRV